MLLVCCQIKNQTCFHATERVAQPAPCTEGTWYLVFPHGCCTLARMRHLGRKKVICGPKAIILGGGNVNLQGRQQSGRQAASGNISIKKAGELFKSCITHAGMCVKEYLLLTAAKARCKNLLGSPGKGKPSGVSTSQGGCGLLASPHCHVLTQRCSRGGLALQEYLGCTGEALGAPSCHGHHVIFIDLISPLRSGVEQGEWSEISGKIRRCS